MLNTLHASFPHHAVQPPSTLWVEALTIIASGLAR
jgi:hypothetical protein